MERSNASLAEYRGRSNVNSVKRSKAMGRPKEQEAGWINDEEKKKERQPQESGRK